MADFVPTFRLTHEASMKMLAAGVARADELGVKVALAVCDQSCEIIAFLVMDGARHFAGRTTTKKAKTAASQRLPTGYAEEHRVVSMQIRMDGEFTNVRGGFPVVVNGETVGGVGAGGAHQDEDVEVAKARRAAIGQAAP
ncbi:MAG: heme-binding protein [Beijerinckiaceae bacterium]